MAYNRGGYYLRAKRIQEITAQHYEPENQARCKKQIWKKYIYPEFGMCYETYLKYQGVALPKEAKENKQSKLSVYGNRAK